MEQEFSIEQEKTAKQETLLEQNKTVKQESSIKPVQLTERISYIPASKHPLSADVVLVEGDEYLYVFDVGNNEQVAEYVNAISKKKKVILSEFQKILNVVGVLSTANL